MPRKNRFQWSEGEIVVQERKSRSQQKRESNALQELGESLASLPLKELEQLPIKPDLLLAFQALPKITSREAKRRHFQYIGRLMREEEQIDILEQAIEIFKEGMSPSAVLSKNLL